MALACFLAGFGLGMLFVMGINFAVAVYLNRQLD